MIRRARGMPWRALCAAAALVLVGCDSISDDAQNRSLRALAQPVAAPAGFDAPARPRPCAREDFAPSRLPPVGRMPDGSFMEHILERGKLHVGVDQNTLRLGYFNPTRGSMEGFDIALARAVARAIFGRSRDRIVFTAISTAQRDDAIKDGKVDLVASAYSITCKRMRTMLFSSVYYRAQQKLLVPEDSQVESLSDLRGERVCATNSSTSIGSIAGTGVVPHPVELRPDCLVELQEGRVAAITADDSILFGFRLQDPQTKIVGDCINLERYGMAINRSHPEFVGFVNGVLERLGADGLEDIRHHWLRELPAPTNAEIRRCGRLPDRLRAEIAADRRRSEDRLADSRRRWRRTLAAPPVVELYHCDRDCSRRASS